MALRMHRAMLFVAVLPFLVSCGDRLLYADFQDGPIGAQPESNLPGPPEGDRLGVGSGPRNAATITDGGETSPVLSVRGEGVVTFQAVPADPGIENYFLSWDLYPLLVGSGEMSIVLLSGHDFGFGAFVLRLRNGQIFLLNADDEEEALGTYAHSQKLTALISIDLPARSYTLTILRRGDSNLQVRDRTLDGDRFGESRSLTLTMGVDHGSNFMIDNVLIKEGEEE